MIVARYNVLGLKVVTSIVVEIMGCSLSLLVNEVCESINLFLKKDRHSCIDSLFIYATQQFTYSETLGSALFTATQVGIFSIQFKDFKTNNTAIQASTNPHP